LIYKKTNRFSTKARRSVRAISPVIATLLMIAIAVAASLVAYAWVMGYIGTTTDSAGRSVMIQSVAKDSAGEITVYVQNTGEADTRIRNIYVNDVQILDYNDVIHPGDTVGIRLPPVPLADPSKVTVKVYTDQGTFFEYKKTFTGASGSGGANPTPTPTSTATPEPVTLTERVTSRALINNVNFPGPTTVNFASAPQEGSLLIATVGHRVGTTGSTPIPSIDGWTLAEIENSNTGISDRRVVAVFYKEASSSEPTAVTISWTNTDSGANGFVILQEFTPSRDTSYSKVVSGKSNSGPVGTANEVTSLTIPASPLTAPTQTNILSFAATVWRDDTPTMTGNTFSELSGVQMAYGGTPARGFTAYANTAVLQTTATMTGSTDPDLVSGVLVLFACS